jgi:hypothetical protein
VPGVGAACVGALLSTEQAVCAAAGGAQPWTWWWLWQQQQEQEEEVELSSRPGINFTRPKHSMNNHSCQ